MNTYIALLRGINVSGRKKINMADLRAHLEELPFKDIKTYIQRGNIVFSSAIDDLAIIKSMIYNKIYEKHQFEIPTLILEPAVLDYVLYHNPFLQEIKDPKRLYITFFNDVPAPEYIDNLDAKAYLPEDFVSTFKVL